MNTQTLAAPPHIILGFGIVPELPRRGDERFFCRTCDFVTCGVSDPVFPDPPIDGTHELYCPRCRARLSRCPSCGKETSVRPDGELWRCDACKDPIQEERTLHRNIPTLRQLGVVS